MAIPGPGDLNELRGAGRDRAERTVETFAREFALLDRRCVTTQADLDAAAVQDVLHSIYRPLRSQPVEAMRLIRNYMAAFGLTQEELDITCSTNPSKVMGRA